LEIKIAYIKGGIYHEKAGIFKDEEGNIVAFNGSGNETPGGWRNNTESFHAFTSWDDDRHIKPELVIFERLWNGNDPRTTVVPLPFAVVKGLLDFKDYFKDGMDDPIDVLDLGVDATKKWTWTPELAFVFESQRLWNHRDFAYAETAIKPFEHQDYIASSVLKNWPPRFLFADEVGLGKTIEAGLVIKGFIAAGRVDRLIILAPANAMKQWQEELLNKFGLETWRLDGNYVVAPQTDPHRPPRREKVDAVNPFRSKPYLIVSSQLIRSEERLEQICQLEYDLIILDEAHHARASNNAGRREENKLLQAMGELRYNTLGLILMTATPIQLSRLDLWDLLGILELPGKWQDQNSFDRFFQMINEPEPDWKFLLDMANSGIQQGGFDQNEEARVLRDDYLTIDVYKLTHIVKENDSAAVKELSEEELKALKVLLFRLTPVRQMTYRHTRELLKRYRKEGKFSGKIADRNPSKERVELRGTDDDLTSERGLYHRIDQYVRVYYAKYNNVRKGMGFLMEVYRKRLTSSFYAIKLSLKKRHGRLGQALETGDFSIIFKELEEEEFQDLLPDNLMDEFIDEEGKTKASGNVSALRDVVTKEYEYLGNFIEHLNALPNDTKAEHLDTLLAKIFGSGKKQVIIFSQFMDTVNFLLEYFRAKYGERLGSYSGDGGKYWDSKEWKKCSKQEIQNKFADPSDRMDLLICTDAASESLNLQTCDTVINYDVPWNPMRIEQRIGRIDRIGQESPIVNVYTIFYKDSVEEKAYDRCLKRIGYFKTTLGHLQPILQSTERAIRDASMAGTPEEEAAIIERMDNEYEIIAQTEEDLRIERLLNYYTPQLDLLKNRAPVTQQELENVIAPSLEAAGWQKNDAVWKREEASITFDQTFMDRKGGEVELVTPHSSLSKYIGNLPELPESIGHIHRIQMSGLVGFAVESNGRFYIANNLSDLKSPKGDSYPSLEEARMGLKYKINEQRLQYLEADRKAWINRHTNWKVRVNMYLDNVARWRWKSARTEGALDNFSDETLAQVWNKYLNDSDRTLTKQLVEIVSYKPTFDPAEKGKGRISTKSPKDARKEQSFLDDLRRITQKINLNEEQRKGIV
ncbi:MAG: helicase-related protein, partial [Thermoplasmata archaeon]|nr:helicase-related protein [Thermoplasmata archaeon]